MRPMRLHKYLSRAGVASVRKAEKIILEGRISVNGKTVRQLGVSVEPGKDCIELDGQRLKLPPTLYLVMNKPAGYITTLKDTHGRPTVADLLSELSQRVYPVGRLD